LSVRDAAQEIASGRLTAEALASACLDRIAAREAVVGAWHYLDRDAALAAARQRDAEPPRGPLHGIPIAVKDLIDTADMPTGYGSPIYEGHRPAAGAACAPLAHAAAALWPLPHADVGRGRAEHDRRPRPGAHRARKGRRVDRRNRRAPRTPDPQRRAGDGHGLRTGAGARR